MYAALLWLVLCEVPVLSLWQVLLTKSLIKWIFWNWNIKFHVGKSILTCRVKVGIEAKKEKFKCKLVYHSKHGNLCWCRNLDFHEILALSVSFSSAEEKERVDEKLHLILSSCYCYRKFSLFSFHIGFEFSAHVKNGKNGIGFWKHKSLVYYVLLKLWEQSSYLKLSCNLWS